jgi:uncharacterized protein YjbI with pentapeptide repeats
MRRSQPIFGRWVSISIPRAWRSSRWPAAAAVSLGLAWFVLIAYLVLKLAPDWFAETEGLNPTARADARQGVRTASLALLAGAIAVVGAVYTARTFALNRAGQLTDRFTKAIEQLGHTELDVRLGGIYALERIARDSREDHHQVVEVLTAYVREHAPRLEEQAEGPTASGPARTEPGPATDVQAVLTVLGRRTLAHERHARVKLDLRSTQLGMADLRGASLTEAIFTGADLRSAHLDQADLRRATLIDARLRGAHLNGADLTGANLFTADLTSARLRHATLVGANLSAADLTGARLADADLSAAQFSPGGLTEATKWPAGFSPIAAGARPTGA